MSNDPLFREPLQTLRTAALFMLMTNPRALAEFVPGTIADALPDIRNRRLKEAVKLVAEEVDRRIPTTPVEPAKVEPEQKPECVDSWTMTRIEDEHGVIQNHTRSLRVPGGWLIQVSYNGNSQGRWFEPTFVPDVAAQVQYEIEAALQNPPSSVS